MPSAMNSACFSLSMTQGPAMRNRSPEPMRTPSTWNERLTGYVKVKSISPQRAKSYTEENQRNFFLCVCPQCNSVPSVVKVLSRHFQRPVEHFYLGRVF